MKFLYALVSAGILLVCSSIGSAQGNPNLENANAAVLRAFDTHDIVMFSEMHSNKQEYDWLRSLVATPEFADRVDDIVMEFGNSLYQKSVDRYVSREDVPFEQVQKAWGNMAGSVGPPSPVYGSLYQTVRETNIRRKGKHQMRVVCGDPYIDWDRVKDREDIAPFLDNRDQWYTQVVKEEVLAKDHRALLVMGAGHFFRRSPFTSGPRPFSIEHELQSAGAKTYLIVLGTNATGGYDNLDPRFDSWPAPVMVPLADSWVGGLPALPVVTGGAGVVRYRLGPSPGGTEGPPSQSSPVKLKDVADALLYLGPRDSLTAVYVPRSELVGTPYGKEIERRLAIEGFPSDFISQQLGYDSSGKNEGPQFPRPQPVSGGPPALPPPPKNAGAPLPPRPPSQ
jgi:hypothetical protein